MSRFLVFADIGNGVALFDRTDGTIWFNESHDPEIRRPLLEMLLKSRTSKLKDHSAGNPTLVLEVCKH